METTLEVAVRRARTAIAAAQVAGMMKARSREVKVKKKKSATKATKTTMVAEIEAVLKSPVMAYTPLTTIH